MTTTTEPAPRFDTPDEGEVGDVYDLLEPEGFDADEAAQRALGRKLAEENIAMLEAEIAAMRGGSDFGAAVGAIRDDEIGKLEAELAEQRGYLDDLGGDPYALDPGDERRASWAMRRLAEAHDRIEALDREHADRRAEIDEWVHSLVGDALDRLDQWHERERRRAEGGVLYFEGLLTARAVDRAETMLRDKLAAAAQRLGDSATAEDLRAEAWRLVKGKTWDLPEGRVDARIGVWTAEVTDEDRFVEWAQANGHDDLLRVAVKPHATVMRDRLRRALALGDEITVRPATPDSLRRRWEYLDDLTATKRARFERLNYVNEITGGLGFADTERAEFDRLPDEIADLHAQAVAAYDAWEASSDGEVPAAEPVPGVRMSPPEIVFKVRPDPIAPPDAEPVDGEATDE